MTYRLFFLFISSFFFTVKGGDQPYRYLDKTDEIPCNNTKDIIIEMAVLTNGEYAKYDTERKAGVQIWRDQIKSICVDKSDSTGPCVVKKPICLRIVDIYGETNKQLVLTNLKQWASDCLKKANDVRPRFLITPLGVDNVNAVIDTIGDKQLTDKWKIPILASGPFVSASTLQLAFTPFPDLKRTFVGLIEGLKYRYNVRTVVFIGDTLSTKMMDDAGAALINQMSDFNVLLKRCSNYVTLMNPPPLSEKGLCNSKEDCDDNFECVFPKVELSKTQDYLNFKLASEWIRYIKALAPDLLVLASDYYVPNFMKIIALEEYTPYIALGIQYNEVVTRALTVKQNPSSWHYSATYVPEMEFGEKNLYLGTSQDVRRLIEQNFAKYTNPIEYPKGTPELMGSYRYYAEGMIAGVTIQRIIELTFHELEGKTDASEYVSGIASAFHTNFHTCPTSTTRLKKCSDCGDTTKCTPLNSFFGPIQFLDNNVVNQAKTSLLVQVKVDSQGNITNQIVSPFDSPGCNGDVLLPPDKQICLQSNGFSGCTCRPQYSEWGYVREIHNNFIGSSSAVGIIFVLLGVIQLLVEFYFIFNLIRRNKYWDTVCLPYSTMLYPLLSIFMSLYSIVQTGEHSTAICSTRNFFDYLNLFYVTVILLLSSVEEISRLKRQEPSKAFYRVEISAFSLGVIFIALIGTLTYIVETVTTIDLTQLRPYYDIKCGLHDELYVIKVLLGCVIVIAMLLLYGLRHSASFFFRGLQYYFVIVTFIFFLCELIMQIVGSNEQIHYILVWVYSWLLSWCYIYPFISPRKLMEDRKISDILLKPKYVRTAMRELLDDKLQSHIFAVFLSSKENYSQYIDLYIDIEKHKLISDAGKLREDEKAIFATYLSGSAKQLSAIDANTTANINTEMGKGNCNAFNDLENAIVTHFLENNLYEEFLNSDYYWFIDETKSILRGFRKHAIKTLETVLEDIIVSIVIQETDPAALKQHVAFYNTSLQTRTTRTGSSYTKGGNGGTTGTRHGSDIHQSHIAVDVQPKDPNRSFNDSTLFSSEVNNVSEKLDTDRGGTKKSTNSVSKRENKEESENDSVGSTSKPEHSDNKIEKSEDKTVSHSSEVPKTEKPPPINTAPINTAPVKVVPAADTAKKVTPDSNKSPPAKTPTSSIPGAIPKP